MLPAWEALLVWGVESDESSIAVCLAWYYRERQTALAMERDALLKVDTVLVSSSVTPTVHLAQNSTSCGSAEPPRDAEALLIIHVGVDVIICDRLHNCGVLLEGGRSVGCHEGLEMLVSVA